MGSRAIGRCYRTTAGAWADPGAGCRSPERRGCDWERDVDSETVVYSLTITTVVDEFASDTLDPYAERILEAARELLIAHGLRRTSLADIARAAGVSEATLYRRFATRDELLRTLVAREATAFIARVDRRISRVQDPVERLVIAFVMFARSLHEHELIQRLLVTDPERLLPLLTTDGSPALRLASGYVLAQAERAIDAGAVPTTDPVHVAELLVRIAHSLVLTPQTSLPIEDDDRLAELARSALAPLAFTTTKGKPR